MRELLKAIVDYDPPPGLCSTDDVRKLPPKLYGGYIALRKAGAYHHSALALTFRIDAMAKRSDATYQIILSATAELLAALDKFDRNVKKV